MSKERIKGWHLRPKRGDMEIIENLLRTHFGVEAKIEARPVNPYKEIFIKVTKALNAKVVVELGTGHGGSCGAFVTALKETGGRLYSVDINWEQEVTKLCIQKHMSRGDPVTFIHGDSVEVGKKWSKGDIDILYCDSDHGYEHVLNELETWGRFNPKIILLHDMFYGKDIIGGPYRAAKEYAEKHGKLFVVLKFEVGLGIIAMRDMRVIAYDNNI